LVNRNDHSANIEYNGGTIVIQASGETKNDIDSTKLVMDISLLKKDKVFFIEKGGKNG
jgi:hypothetical protein